MIRLLGPGSRLCDGLNRREVLRIGSLGLVGSGLSLPALAAGPLGGSPSLNAGDASFGRAKSCILLFLIGGPPQHSTWDPKPDAPAEIRGDFRPIATRVPGLSFSELMPATARVADKVCVLRAMSTGDHAHSSSGYYMLTGRPHQPMNVEDVNPGAPNDSPSLGAVIGALASGRSALPPSATLPQKIMNTGGSTWPGQDAGFLGKVLDPWLLNALPTPQGYRIQEIDLPADLEPTRMAGRRGLLDQLGRGLDDLGRFPTAGVFDGHTRRAFELLQSPETRRAFRLDLEPEAVRERYGPSPFGQGVLLARRLVESGVRLVQVNWYRGPDEPPTNPCWDSHFRESERLKDVLMPPTDRAYSALLEDLESRGLLEETLVICMAEFGRSPRLDVNGGRGHWGSVFSVALAGGGVVGGQAYGASDRIGAFPQDGLVRPEDLSATLFHCLGHEPQSEIQDRLGRPHPISRGNVLHAIL